MNDDGSSQFPDVADHQTDRRRLLTLLGVGGAAALAGSVVAPQEARAGHDSTNTFHLGEENNAAATTTLSGDIEGHLFQAFNSNTEGIGIFAGASTSTAIGGVAESGNGVLGTAFGTGNGVQGISSGGNGVAGETDTGTAGFFSINDPSGTALAVHGPARFSTAGSATVPEGQSSVFVAHPVTEDSHISVTLTSDPGFRSLGWVERASDGSGFTVHLFDLSTTKPGRGPSPDKPDTSFTYFVVESSAFVAEPSI